MKVKMCGLRRTEDVSYANEVNPDYIGFIFANTWRKVSIDTAAKLRKILNPEIKAVGVFVNESLEVMIQTAKEVPLDVIQLHGDETEEVIQALRKNLKIEIWKAARVQNSEDIENVQKLSVDKILLDSFSKEAYGGTGKVMDISLVEQACIKKPFFIAGGLTIENTGNIIDRIKPFGIDISSGIETKKKKDFNKMKKIMEIAGGKNE